MESFLMLTAWQNCKQWQRHENHKNDCAAHKKRDTQEEDKERRYIDRETEREGGKDSLYCEWNNSK